MFISLCFEECTSTAYAGRIPRRGSCLLLENALNTVGFMFRSQSRSAVKQVKARMPERTTQMHTLVKYTLARRLYRDIVRGFDLLMPLGFLSGPSFLLLSFRFGFEDEEARKRLLGPFGLWHLPALDDYVGNITCNTTIPRRSAGTYLSFFFSFSSLFGRSYGAHCRSCRF